MQWSTMGKFRTTPSEAQLRQSYVEPFATQDIGVFVMMKTEPTGLVTTIPGWDYLKKRGYTEIRGEAIVVEGWPVQFIPVSNALEEEAYLNATALDFEGEPVRVFLAEHLVANYAASRPIERSGKSAD